MRREILCAVLHLCGSALCCQNRDVKKSSIDAVIEKIIEIKESDSESDPDFIEELSLLYSRLEMSPLNINRVRESDLERLKIFSPFEINSILDYISQTGNILSFTEFALIPGVDPEKLLLLQPFLIFEGGLKRAGRYLPLESETLLRSSLVLQKRAGYMPISKEEYLKNPDIRYLGNPLHMYGRTSVGFGEKAQLIITLEKDPGERGADYLAWSATLNRISISKKVTAERIVAGSYVARFGQGLILWNGFNIDSSWEPSANQRGEQGVTPYSGSDENLALKGIAATFESGRVTATVLFSSRAYDARIADGGYTSLLKTGLHNTPTTLSRKRTLGSDIAALNIGYSGRRLKIGTTISADNNSLLYTGRDTTLLKRAAAYGRFNANFGADFRYIFGKSIFFGEVAADISRSFASVCGVLLRYSDRGELSAVYEFSQEDYLSRHSVIKAASGGVSGFRISARQTISSKLKIFLVSKVFDNSKTFSAMVEADPYKNYKFTMRGSVQQERSYLRTDIKIGTSDRLLSHTRGDISVSKTGNTLVYGFHLHQEFVLKLFSDAVSLSSRVAWFDVQDWKNRIYSYEREMLYQFRTTALYGKGIRYYLNVKATVNRFAEIWFRYSSTIWSDREKTGEGLEMIQGPSRSDVKIQLRIRF